MNEAKPGRAHMVRIVMYVDWARGARPSHRPRLVPKKRAKQGGLGEVYVGSAVATQVVEELRRECVFGIRRGWRGRMERR